MTSVFEDLSAIYSVALKGAMADTTTEVRNLELTDDIALLIPYFKRRTLVTILNASPELLKCYTSSVWSIIPKPFRPFIIRYYWFT